MGIAEAFGRLGIRNEVLWNPAEIKLIHKVLLCLLWDSNVAKTFAMPRSRPISTLKEQGLSETISRMRIKLKSYCVRTSKLFKWVYRSAKVTQCMLESKTNGMATRLD